MATWVSQAAEHLWQNGLAAIPLIVITAGAVTLLPCRPSTRHLIWFMVLVWPILPPLLPGAANPWADEAPDNDLAGTTVELVELSAEPKSTTPQPRPAGAADGAPWVRPEQVAASPVDPSPRSLRPPGAAQTGTEQDVPKGPSPRSGALAASATPDLLAQPRGAVGLPPTVHEKHGHVEPVTLRAFCPLMDPPEPICPADPPPVERGRYAPTRQPRPGTWTRRLPPVPPRRDVNETAGLAGVAAAPPGDQSDRPAAAPDRSHGRSRPIRPERTAIGTVAADERTAPAGEPAWVATEEASLAAEAQPPGARQPAGESRTAQWAAALLRLRDDLTLLPPLPTEIWLAGSLVLIAVGIVRVGRFRQLLRSADPAGAEVRAMVADASREIGLRRVPEVFMVRRCVSPMVWCIARPRLLLPAPLWSDLDDVGRRAVVMHELAHLRRRDHWVLWADGLVGCLYWWHPAIWWVRRRLRMEAEYCCDAWVTTLLPRTRRAYAQALLKTRQYVGEGSGFVPAMGIGITSGRAKRFARRLTMVMTTSEKPRASVWGLGLVLLLATSGWVASPARSCPKSDAEAGPCDHKPHCDKTAPCDADKSSERVKAGPKPEKDLTSYERHLAERADGAEPPAVAEFVLTSDERAEFQEKTRQDQAQVAEQQARVAELQAQLHQLARRIEELNREAGQGRAPRGHAPGDGRSRGGVLRLRGPRPPRAAMPPAPPVPPMPRTVVVPAPSPDGPRGMFAPVPPAPKHLPKPGQTWADVSDEKVEWRTYKLSEGKLKDFTKFMSRSDVPILIRPKSEAIEIRATPGQHALFHVFFQMVDPSEERAEAGFFAPTIAVGIGEGRAHAHGQGRGGCAAGCSSCECDRCREVQMHRDEARRIRHEARAMANEFRARAQGEAARIRAEARARAHEIRDQLRQEARRIRTEAENQEELIESLEEQSDALREQAERMRERAERIRERAEEVRERREEGDDEDEQPRRSDGAFQLHLEALERSALALNEESEAVMAKVVQILDQMEIVRQGSAGLERHADEFDGRAEAIEELSASIESLEAGPELAMSLARLATTFEGFVVPISDAVESELLSAMMVPGADAVPSVQAEASWEASVDAAVGAAVDALEGVADDHEADEDTDNDQDDEDDKDDDRD